MRVTANEQMNGRSADLEIDSRLLEQLGWSGFWDALKQRMADELAQTRRVRPLLQVYGGDYLDPDSIPDFSTPSDETSKASNGSLNDPYVLTVPARAGLVSAEIRQEFRLRTDQLGDLSVAKFFISKAAHNVGLAEDGLLLYGHHLGALRESFCTTAAAKRKQAAREKCHPKATGCEERRYLESIQCQFLDQQGCGLFRPWASKSKDHARPAPNPNDQKPKDPDHPPETPIRDIVRAISGAITQLCYSGHCGPYCLLVSQVLYAQMFRQEEGTVPISELLPLLRENGVGWTPELPHLHVRYPLEHPTDRPGLGGQDGADTDADDPVLAAIKNGKSEYAIVWSNGGSAIGLDVPREAHLEFVGNDNGKVLCVTERVRLIVNAPCAMWTLGPWDISKAVRATSDMPSVTAAINDQTAQLRSAISDQTTKFNGAIGHQTTAFKSAISDQTKALKNALKKGP